MSFISTATHQKFISHCNRLVTDTLENTKFENTDEEAKRLVTDLDKLQQLAEDYLNRLSQLSQLTSEYNLLQRNIRVAIRKIQVKANRS